MKNVLTLALGLASVLLFSSCTADRLDFTPATTSGTYSADLAELGASAPSADCLGVPVTLNEGNLKINYNVVNNSNTTNAVAHVLLNNLKFTSEAGVNYVGNFDLKLNAHAARNAVLRFETTLKLVSPGATANTVAKLSFQIVYNANGTMTASNLAIVTSCE